MHSEFDRTLALAGVYQGAALAQQIGRKGLCDSQAMEASIYSLFQVDAADVLAVYGGLPGLRKGLELVHRQFEGGTSRDLELTRHVIALLGLERKLAGRPEMLDSIAQGLALAGERLQHYPMLHTNILSQLAEIYSDTISRIPPRIMVRGEVLHLQNPDNQHKIRSLLLAGIRSAMLWNQLGGRRRQILFGRRRIQQSARALLERARAENGATNPAVGSAPEP